MQISHAILIGSAGIALAIIFDGPITQYIVEAAKKGRILPVPLAEGVRYPIEDPLLEYAKELDRKIEEMRRERPRFSQRKAQ